MSPRNSGPDWLGFILLGARWLLLVLALAGLVVTWLPYLRTDTWWIRYLDFPRIEFLAAMAIVAVLLVALPSRTWLNWGAAGLLVVACAWNLSLLAPYLAPLVVSWPAPPVPSGACPAGERLRVLEANVQMTNRHDHRLLEMVREADPDIAWFQETDVWWERELAPLGAMMPFGVAKAQNNYFGVHLFSKLKLEDAQVHYLTQSRNPSVFASVTLAAGGLVRLYAIHPRPPQIGQSTAERDAQLMATALAAHDDATPHVTLGDMNAVPWERAIHRTERIGGFGDPRIGRGIYITWNAEHLLLKWPLDQILPGPEFTLAALRVLPAFGSDHKPLLADLCLTPNTAARPARGAATAEDLAEARETVVRGQGDAKGK